MTASRDCILMLKNTLPEALVLVACSGTKDGDRGLRSPAPPQALAAGQAVTAKLASGKDNSGSSGWVTYALASDATQTITFSFQCGPFVGEWDDYSQLFDPPLAPPYAPDPNITPACTVVTPSPAPGRRPGCC